MFASCLVRFPPKPKGSKHEEGTKQTGSKQEETDFEKWLLEINK
jgi:hypothetical protein